MKPYNIGEYRIEQLADGVFAIDDTKECTVYLIDGEERAIAVDTGMMKGQIMQILKKLTDKPIDLVLTHAHIDHMFHADEFENVYIFEDEQKNWKKKTRKTTFLGAVGYGIKIKKYNVANYLPIKEGGKLNLKGRNITVFRLKGHTPGSCVLVDESCEKIFCGDALDGGIGVWLWLSDACTVKEYREDLILAEQKLLPYKDYELLSGHRCQSFENGDFVTKKQFSYANIAEMIQLCDLMIAGEIQPVEKQKAFIFTLEKYQYKNASMWRKKGQKI